MNLYKSTLVKQKSYSNSTQEVYVIAKNIGEAELKALEANTKKFNAYYEGVLRIDVVATENEFDNIGIIHF